MNDIRRMNDKSGGFFFKMTEKTQEEQDARNVKFDPSVSGRRYAGMNFDEL